VLKVRLYRPFPTRGLPRRAAATCAASPCSTAPRSRAPSASRSTSTSSPRLASPPRRQGAGSARVIGGRYGLGSKEFTPAMVKAVFDELKPTRPSHHFTVGIVTTTSPTCLDVDDDFDIEPTDVVRAECVFYGLGADGTVGANKNSIKIIGERPSPTPRATSSTTRRSRARSTVSHLRFGPDRSARPT
jgi:pyruvate-ferredoxin/flavodoxin oxidoreductase